MVTSRHEKSLYDFLKGTDCKKSTLTIDEIGITLLFSQLIENPKKAPKIFIRVRRGGPDVSGLEIYKIMSSANSARWCLDSYISIQDIKGFCLILATSGSMMIIKKMEKEGSLDRPIARLRKGQRYFDLLEAVGCE